jgi:hypothetical protein
MKIKIAKNKGGKIVWSTKGITVHSMGDKYKEVDISEADFDKITKKGNKYKLDEKGKLKDKSKK